MKLLPIAVAISLVSPLEFSFVKPEGKRNKLIIVKTLIVSLSLLYISIDNSQKTFEIRYFIIAII